MFFLPPPPQMPVGAGLFSHSRQLPLPLEESQPSIRSAVPVTLLHRVTVTATPHATPGLFSVVPRRIYLCFLCTLMGEELGFSCRPEETE